MTGASPSLQGTSAGRPIRRRSVLLAGMGTAALMLSEACSAGHGATSTGRTPARRWGQVEDVVGPAVWLASNLSDFVNGQLIYVDGGLTAVL